MNIKHTSINNKKRRMRGNYQKIEIINYLKEKNCEFKEILSHFSKKYNTKNNRQSLYRHIRPLKKESIIEKNNNKYQLSSLWMVAFKDNFKITKKILQNLNLSPEEYLYFTLPTPEKKPSKKAISKTLNPKTEDFEKLIDNILSSAVNLTKKLDIVQDLFPPEERPEIEKNLYKNAKIEIGKYMFEIENHKLTKNQKYLLNFTKKRLIHILQMS